MNLMAFFAIGAGAAFGAWLRWGLSEVLNPLIVPIMLGTLVANLVGGLLMGGVLAFFSAFPALSPTLKFFVTTGFLGGLTTFSTFSGEALGFIQRGDWGWLGLHVASHVVGAILATWAGYMLFQSIRG